MTPDRPEDLQAVLASSDWSDAEVGCYGLYPNRAYRSARLVRWTHAPGETRGGLRVHIDYPVDPADLDLTAALAWAKLHPED